MVVHQKDPRIRKTRISRYLLEQVDCANWCNLVAPDADGQQLHIRAMAFYEASSVVVLVAERLAGHVPLVVGSR